MLTNPPVTMLVVFRLMPAPEVPTVTSPTTVVPSVLYRRAKVAVPVATAVPDVIAFAVMTPAAAEPKAVAPNVNVASNVLLLSAVFAFTGCVPVKN